MHTPSIHRTRLARSAPAGIGSVLYAAAVLSLFTIGIAHADPAPAMIGATNATVTYDCGSQPTITINGVNSTVTLTGSCSEVNVAGTNNTVHLATVAQVDATGTGNNVTWQTGPGGLPPRISNTGIRNTVNQR
jgi:hypothetical protein